MSFQTSPGMRASIVRWAEAQQDNPSLLEAVRRLVEVGLAARKPPLEEKQAARRANTANEMAALQLDRLADPKASSKQRASRKRRLLRGPTEFQSVRVDGSGSK